MGGGAPSGLLPAGLLLGGAAATARLAYGAPAALLGALRDAWRVLSTLRLSFEMLDGHGA